MPNMALSSPVHLTIHPEEPIRSLAGAAKVVERHASGDFDIQAAKLAEKLKTAKEPEDVRVAEQAFREWVADHGLLLVPPEDSEDAA